MIDKIYKRLIDQGKKSPDDKVNSIITNHMVWSMGAGLIPVPIADFFAVSAIQLDMIRQIAKVYDIDFSEQAGKAFITALTSSGLARMGARAIKFIPGIGSVLGGVTMSVLSGASSYALGQVFKKHFETGGTFLDFEPSRVKKFYDEQFEKGRKIAKEYKEDDIKKATDQMQQTSENLEQVDEQPVNELIETKDPLPNEEDPISKILKLSEMKSKGIITEEEFLELKKQIINKV